MSVQVSCYGKEGLDDSRLVVSVKDVLGDLISYVGVSGRWWYRRVRANGGRSRQTLIFCPQDKPVEPFR